MKADLEFVSRSKTFMQMKIRLEECKTELREIQEKRTISAVRLIKELLNIK